MKTKVIFSVIAATLLLSVTAGDLLASGPSARPKKEQQQVITIRGRVVDNETGPSPRFCRHISAGKQCLYRDKP